MVVKSFDRSDYLKSFWEVRLFFLFRVCMVINRKDFCNFRILKRNFDVVTWLFKGMFFFSVRKDIFKRMLNLW